MKLSGSIRSIHIAKGECGKPSRCALALSLAEMFDVPYDRVFVDGVNAAILDRMGYETAGLQLSESLKMWVHRFDCGKQVESVDIVAMPSGAGSADYLLDLV